MLVSSGARMSSIGTDSDIVSYGSLASKEPSLSNLILRGGGGGSKATNEMPWSLREQQS
jgi:hypothetical protein